MSKLYLPESLYSVNPSMSYKALSIFHKNNATICGQILRLDTLNESFDVDLGNNITGLLPFDEATIYPILKENGDYGSAIYDLIGKNVQVKIIDIGHSNIILSRKANMLEAVNVLKYKKHITTAEVTGFSQLSAFVDIGAGITGRVFGKKFANTKFLNVQDIGIKKGDFISVKVLEFLDTTNNFELSRVDALPHFSDFLAEGMEVVCKVFDPIPNDPEKVGYYVCIPYIDEDNTIIPGVVCGMLDSPNVELPYGTTVACTVSKISSHGPRLDLVRVLNIPEQKEI